MDIKYLIMEELKIIKEKLQMGQIMLVGIYGFQYHQNSIYYID